MILSWNTLNRASKIINDETGNRLDELEVLHVCYDYGISPHIQLYEPELAKLPNLPEQLRWVTEGGMAELRFNLDVQSFFKGDGLIMSLWRDETCHLLLSPPFPAKIEDLRLSKDALIRLLYEIKRHQIPTGRVAKASESKQIEKQEISWVAEAQKRADYIYKKLKVVSDPSKKAIAEMIAKEFDAEGIRSVKDKRLNDVYIVRHALNTWKRPEN